MLEKTEKFRSGSMMTMDSEREVHYDHRKEYNDEYWCMFMPQKGIILPENFTIQVDPKIDAKPFIFYKLNRNQHSVLYTVCPSRRCTLITLPPGITPHDLQVAR